MTLLIASLTVSIRLPGSFRSTRFVLVVLLFLPLVTIAEELIRFPREDSFLPVRWLEEPIEAEIEPLDEALIERARNIIERGVGKYPEEIIREFLSGIYLVGSLRFYDVGYGGTYMSNSSRIVLVYRETFDPVGFEQRFHHEL